MNYKDYIDFLSAALTPVIALITVYIAYQQYRTNKIRLQHDLYERRVEVFRGVLQLLSAVLRQGGVVSEDIVNLVRSTSEKEFLFDNDICQYINDIYSKGVELWSIREQLRDSDLIDKQDKSMLLKKQSELLMWLTDQLPQVRKKFSKYLSMAK